MLRPRLQSCHRKRSQKLGSEVDRWHSFSLTAQQTTISSKNQPFSRHEYSISQKQSGQKYDKNAKLLSRTLQLYPQNVFATCRPWTAKNILQLITQKRANQNIHCETLSELPRPRHLLVTVPFMYIYMYIREI